MIMVYEENYKLYCFMISSTSQTFEVPRSDSYIAGFPSWLIGDCYAPYLEYNKKRRKEFCNL